MNMLHPNCSELVIKVEYKDLDDLKSLIKTLLEKTKAKLAVHESIFTYSKIPLAQIRDREILHYPVDPDDIVIKQISSGELLLGVNKEKLPQNISRQLPPWAFYGGIVSVYLTKERSSILLTVDNEFIEFSINHGEQESYKLFAEISRVLFAPPFLDGGGSIVPFWEWCKTNGYEDIAKECEWLVSE